MSDSLTKRDQRDRSKINMHEDFEVKYWTKALGVSKDELQKRILDGRRGVEFALRLLKKEV